MDPKERQGNAIYPVRGSIVSINMLRYSDDIILSSMSAVVVILNENGLIQYYQISFSLSINFNLVLTFGIKSS